MMGTHRAQRRLSGAALVKLLVWAVVFFGAYSAFKYLGVSSVGSTIERAVDETFGELDHGSSHHSIKHLIVRRVAVASIELDPENIRVETERRPGEFLVDVQVEHPVTVSFLGSPKVLSADVHVTRSIPVDEAALARHAKQRAEVDEHWVDVRDALKDCKAKWGRGNCKLSETPAAEYGVVRDF